MCGVSGVGRSPNPDHSSFWACSRGPSPTGCGRGGCGCGDLSPTPQRALLRAGFARCGGGTRAHGGGASYLGVGCPGSALSHPRPLVVLGVRPGPTTQWLWVLGVRAWGPVTNPTARALVSWLCALWRRHEGARGGRLLPGCGAPGVGALPSPTTRPFGRAAGAHYPLAVGAGGAGVGTRHQPHRARSCELALRAVGAARGRPGGAPLAWVWAVWGRALSQPRPLVLSGVRPGPTTHWLWVRGVRASGPVTNPTARALASWLCVLWGRHEATRGGRLLPGCGVFGVGRSPTPDHSSFRACGRGPLPTGCGCGGCGRWDPSPTPQPALLRAGLARWGGVRGCPGGGAPLAWAWGVRGRALSQPRPPVLCGVRPGPTTHWLLVRGVRAWGPITNPTARAPARLLCALWRRHEAARGGRLLPGCGASGVGRSPTPDHSSFRACGRGSLPTGCGCGGCRRGDPSPTPQRALLRAGFARCGVGMRVPGGGTFLPRCGASRVGRSPTPDHSSFRACGRGPLPTCCGCGGCGRGDPSPTPQRALLRAALTCCEGGTRAPGGGASYLGVGRSGSALSNPRPLVLLGVRPGPTTHWLWVRGVRAWGPVTNPTARALASWLCALGAA